MMISPPSPLPWWHHHHRHHHDDITTITITMMTSPPSPSPWWKSPWSYPCIHTATMPLGIGSEMKVSLKACHHKNLPHFPSVSQNCRSLSNCSCPITFAGSLSTDGISGTSQSTQQCRAILTKTHTYIYKHTHKHTHPHRDAHTHIYTNTHTSTHTLARCRLTDTARLTQTNHPIANYYMPYIPTAIL